MNMVVRFLRGLFAKSKSTSVKEEDIAEGCENPKQAELLRHLKSVIDRCTFKEGSSDNWHDAWFEHVELLGLVFPDDVTLISDDLRKPRQEYIEFWGITHIYTFIHGNVEFALKVQASYPHSIRKGTFIAIVFDKFSCTCKVDGERFEVAKDMSLSKLSKNLCISVYRK